MKYFSSRTVLTIATLMATLLVLGGCFRKHIVSTPPAQRPAQRIETDTAAKPEVVEQDAPEVIEATYDVETPTNDEPAAAKVNEGDLEEEPAAAPAETVVHEKKVKEAEDAAEAAAIKDAEAIKAAPMAEMYYIQVGAFSDQENASNVLADLIAQGFKGSKLSKTDAGLYRVQAGAFADLPAAEEGLARLLTDFPKGFIIKGQPKE